jgi:hypothetical protein
MVLEVSLDWLRTGQGDRSGHSSNFLEDPNFKAAFILFEDTYRDLGMNLSPEAKYRASKFFCKDAIALGPTPITRERAEAILRIASPELSRGKEEEHCPHRAGNVESSGVTS